MTKSFAKLSTWLSAFAVLLCAAVLAGDLKVTYENVQPCVPGVTDYSQAVIDLYVTTGADIGMVTFTSTVAPVDGVTFDPTKVEWDSNVIDTTNAPTAALLSSGKLQLKINAPAPLTAAVQPSANPQHICRIYADVDSTLAGQTVALPFDITAATGIQGTKSVTKNNWLSADSIASVDFNVYKSFNFFRVQGATFETDEDTALTISAADTTKFEASAWDTATSTLQPTTDVEFVSAQLGGTNTVIDGKLVFIPYPGSVEVKNGEIVFTPEANWNGEVWVNAVAHSTTIADTDTEVSFPITVNAVSDPLELSFDSNDLVAVEGEAVSGTLTLTATDVDGGKFLTGATVTLGDDFLTIEGTLEQQGSQAGVTTYLFTASGPVVPYTAVAHPSTSWDCPLTVVATDGTDEYELTGTVNVTDTDRAPEITSLTVNGTSTFPLAIKADTALSISATATDPDEEDTAGLDFYWVDATTNPWSYTLAAQSVADFEADLAGEQPLTKGMHYYAVSASSSQGGLFSDTLIDFSVLVENSAPVVPVTSGSIFVLRHEDATTPDPGVATFTATDVDPGDIVQVCAEPTRAAEPAADASCTIEGQYGTMEVVVDGETITATYTMNDATVAANEDTEETLTFYVTDEDEEDFTAITVKCTFQANPPPVLTAATTTVTIAEVDEAGEPTSFEVKVTATDTNVYPAGVSEWKITVPDGWDYETGGIMQTGKVDEGTWTGTATWTVYPVSYDTITGSPRETSAEFGFTVTAVDYATDAEGTLDFTVTVTDVDRLPGAPASVALEPAEPVHGDAITATASGATDEDGDAITGYTYKWAYSADGENFTDLAETTDTLNDAEAIKKGYTVKVTAFAVTKPYGDAEAISEEGFAATVVIGNTAPFVSTLGDQTTDDATVNLEYTWTVDENSADNAMAAAATDVDANDGVDSLTYEVSEISEEVGNLEIDAETGAITFTPAENYNTVETGDTVTFTVTAKDADGVAAANTATVTLVINEVNSEPSFALEDQYVLPGDLGVELTVEAEAEMGANEENQEISEWSIEVLEGAEIFAAMPTVSYEGKSITVKYTIKADATLGATAKVKVTIKDNGTTAGNPDPLEAEAEFTIFLGASPWYPILSFECADPDNHTEGHTVVIDGSDDSSYSITLKGATYEVLPADYVAIGHPGYAPNTELTITVYPWTQKDGTSAEECAASTAVVANYDTPSEPTTDSETELVADENGFVELPKFSVPMAKSYKIEVKKDGAVVQTIEDDFAPNAEGMVIPDIEGMTLQLTEAGEYAVEVSGTNPAGESAAAVLFTVTSEGGEEIDLADEAWEGEFLPGNGEALTNANVRFSWPALKGATAYTLSIFDGDGKSYDTIKGISGTSQTVELTMDGDVTNYSWFVTATNGKSSLDSDEYAFVLSEASGDTLVITKVVAEDGGLRVYFAGVAPDGEIAFSFQYFDVAGLAWTNGNATGDAENGSLALPMGAATAAGDFVVLKQGDGEWKIYEVQAQ